MIWRGLLLREMEERKGKREGTEREGGEFPPPRKVKVSRIKTGHSSIAWPQLIESNRIGIVVWWIAHH